MRKLADILRALAERTALRFKTVRVSTAQVSEQLASEVRALAADRLPAALVLCNGSAIDYATATRTSSFQIVVVDRFVAASDERTLAALAVADELYALFPPCETVDALPGVVAYPGAMQSVGVDPQYVCHALDLTVKQTI